MIRTILILIPLLAPIYTHAETLNTNETQEHSCCPHYGHKHAIAIPTDNSSIEIIEHNNISQESENYRTKQEATAHKEKLRTPEFSIGDHYPRFSLGATFVGNSYIGNYLQAGLALDIFGRRGKAISLQYAKGTGGQKIYLSLLEFEVAVHAPVWIGFEYGISYFKLNDNNNHSFNGDQKGPALEASFFFTLFQMKSILSQNNFALEIGLGF